MRSILALLPLLALTACPGKSRETGTNPPVETDTSSDTSSDTGTEVVPVWSEVRVETSATLTGLYATPGAVYAVGQGGHSWVCVDGTWSGIVTETGDQDLNDVWGTGVEAGIHMVAVGNGGTVATWNGTGWDVVDIGTANLGAVGGPSADDLIAVGWGGVFGNSSGSFTYMDVATGRRFNDVWYDGTSVMAVGESGDYAIYADGNWADEALPSGATMHAVDGLSISDLWAVGDGGLVAHWDGSSWTTQTIAIEGAAVTSSLWGVYVASATAVYAVGDNGIAFLYDGTAWSALPTGVTNNLYAIVGTSEGVIWAAGNRGMAITYDSGGAPAARTVR